MSSYLFIGIGKSNTAQARFFARSQGAEVFGLQESDESVEVYRWIDSWQLLRRQAGNFESFDFSPWDSWTVILSPGIDARRSFFKGLQAREERELDLFTQYYSGRTLVITGSVGKSTFTLRLGEILKRCFGPDDVFVGGNLGRPAFDLFESPTVPSMAVLEVSSFMAERLKRAQFEWGVLLNLFPNHLDRYESLNHYYQAKWSLLARSVHRYYPRELESPQGMAADQDWSLSDPMDTWLRSLSLVIGGSQVKDDFFSNLPSLPHRQEEWRRADGLLCVNDSKATSVQSVIKALQEYTARSSRLCLILGGKDKGDDFSRLTPFLRPTDRVYVYGASRHKILAGLGGGLFKVQESAGFDEAVRAALQSVSSEDILLLSPGCTSWDQFKNFEERGDCFWQLVGRSVP